MGTRFEVRIAAILPVTGIVEENHAVRANQLTEYVTARCIRVASATSLVSSELAT